MKKVTFKQQNSPFGGGRIEKMNKSTVSKVIKKVQNWEGSESIGFIRRACTPSKTIVALNKSLLIRHIINMDAKCIDENFCIDLNKETIQFFGDMSGADFYNWLINS